MPGLMQLEQLEEFEFARRVPREAITPDILVGVRKLDEREEIEPFLRELLPDPTRTPHTSTEIADIITTHVTHAGEALLAAFINKGKSYQKVTAKDVAHQILKLEHIPHLDLMVLLAVGDIHDDAKSGFLAIAAHNNATYIIVDANDVARLFIAYGKVCPRDGSPYAQGKCRTCNTPASEPIEVTLRVLEEPEYTVLSPRDISVAMVKRYDADLLTSRHYRKPLLREVMKTAIWQLRHETFYGSKQAEERFGTKEADCVSLNVYVNMEDIQTANWICQASWIRPDLPEEWRPITSCNEWLGEIQINWRDDYEQMHAFWSTQIDRKASWIDHVEIMLPRIERLAHEAKTLLEAYDSGALDQDALQHALGRIHVEVSGLHHERGTHGLPPLDCIECDTAFGSMLAWVSNMGLPFSDKGRGTWEWNQKLYILRNALDKYPQEQQSFTHEWRKIRRG